MTSTARQQQSRERPLRIGEVDLLLDRPERSRTAPFAFFRSRRVELVADHAQRKKLVALQPEDHFETVDVLGAEEAIAPLRP